MINQVSNAGATNAGNGLAGFGTQARSAAQTQKDQFLSLLTYQLKSQNPTDPYDTDQFSSQLAQFSELETMTEIRDLMADQTESFATLGQVFSNTALPGMIGMNAKVETANFSFEGGDPVKLGYKLPVNANEAVMKIRDSSGVLVKEIDIKGLDMAGGEHTIEWDGTNDNGDSVEAGKYSFEVSAQNSEGRISDIMHYSYGRIDTVRFKPEGTVLMIGNIEVALNEVSDISG